jgi:PAS domain S-box-containing protein
MGSKKNRETPEEQQPLREREKFYKDQLKECEERLRKIDERYQDLLNQMPVAVSQSTLDGKLLFVNEIAAEKLGFESTEDLKEAGVLALYKDPKEREVTIRAIMEKGGFENYPLEFTAKTGETVHTLVSSKLDGDIITGIIVDVTELRRAENKLKESQEQLRRLANHLQTIREEERKRIAREIHDELGQSLTVLKIDMNWLGNQLAESHRPLLKKVSSMSRSIETNIQMVKKISTELRPKVLDDLGLTAAMEWQANRFQERTGIPCRVTLEPEKIDLDHELSTTIFRILQETLTNIIRHAEATRVEVNFRGNNDRIMLEVRDNGRGITEEESTGPHSIGLLGLRERVYSWNGEILIHGKKGEGTTVTVTIPLEGKVNDR